MFPCSKLVNSNVQCFHCRRFWCFSFSNSFSSVQFFIAAVAITLGVIMIALCMTVAFDCSSFTPHQHHGCDCD